MQHKNKPVFIGSVYCLALALFQIILLFDDRGNENIGLGMGLVLYFSVFFIASNIITGVLGLLYKKGSRSLLPVILGAVYIIIRANILAYCDIVFARFGQYLQPPYYIIFLIIMDAIPAILLLTGGIVDFISERKLRQAA